MYWEIICDPFNLGSISWSPVTEAFVYPVFDSCDDIRHVYITSQLAWSRWKGPACWGRQVWLECFERAGIRPNGISAAEESRDLAAICLLVGLKVGNDTPNSCGKHFRRRVFSSAKHTEVQQYSEAGMHRLLLLHHQYIFLAKNVLKVWNCADYNRTLLWFNTIPIEQLRKWFNIDFFPLWRYLK